MLYTHIINKDKRESLWFKQLVSTQLWLTLKISLIICWEIPQQSHFPTSDDLEAAGHLHQRVILIRSLYPYHSLLVHSSADKEGDFFFFWGWSLLTDSKIYLFQGSWKYLFTLHSKCPKITKERVGNLEK